MTKATLDKEIQSITKLIVNQIKPYKPQKVILFGSYARGNPKSYSDIDLAVFSKNFKDEDEIRNMQYLFQKTMAVDTSIEPHPFHPRDLRSPIKGTVVYEILKTGKREA